MYLNQPTTESVKEIVVATPDRKRQEEPTQYVSHTLGTEKETSGKQMYPPLYICPDQAPGKEQKKKISFLISDKILN